MRALMMCRWLFLLGAVVSVDREESDATAQAAVGVSGSSGTSEVSCPRDDATFVAERQSELSTRFGVAASSVCVETFCGGGAATFSLSMACDRPAGFEGPLIAAVAGWRSFDERGVFVVAVRGAQRVPELAAEWASSRGLEATNASAFVADVLGRAVQGHKRVLPLSPSHLWSRLSQITIITWVSRKTHPPLERPRGEMITEGIPR